MQELEQNHQVSNPIQAASEIFYKPTAVFDTISVKDNWSWIPFILVMAMAVIPAYLYFNVVDFEWYKAMIANMQMPDSSPAEIEAFSNTMELGTTSMVSLISVLISVPILMAILAGYFTLWTRNDAKSVHGFTDWYGATWWMAMPSLVNALLGCIYIAMQDPGSQISQAALAPLSLAFIAGSSMTDDWYNLLSAIRLDGIWTIVLAGLCLKSWTNFSFTKSMIVAALPSAIIWSATLFFSL
jgi:hypothetical protein